RPSQHGRRAARHARGPGGVPAGAAVGDARLREGLRGRDRREPACPFGARQGRRACAATEGSSSMSTTSPTARVRVPRIAETAVEQARLSVVPRLRRRTPKVPYVSLVATLLVLGIAGLLMFNTSLQQASSTAAALETQATRVAAERQALERDLQLLRTPLR